jgi:hypothetical protein
VVVVAKGILCGAGSGAGRGPDGGKAGRRVILDRNVTRKIIANLHCLDRRVLLFAGGGRRFAEILVLVEVVHGIS